MSDDQETEVRQRLRRLLPVRPGDGAWRPRVTLGAETDPDGSGARPGRPAAGVETSRSPRLPGEETGPWPGEETGPPPGAGESPPTRRSGLPGPGPFDPGRRGVRALAVVAVLVVLGAAFWAWRARPRVEPVAAPSASAGPLTEVTGQPAAGGPAELVVAVAGRVRRPGLVRLPAGARVADAIAAAGGAQPGVDVTLLNPARKVTDGELIVIGVTPPPVPAVPGAAGAGGVPGAAPGGRVNLNTATVAQLDTLPGVGPVLAERIVAHRDRQGGFRSVGDLRQVEGIGDARYEQLKDLVTV